MKKKVLIYPALMAALTGLSVNAASVKPDEPETEYIDIFSTGHPVLQSMLNEEAKADREKARQESEISAALVRESELAELAAKAEEEKKKEQEISDLQKALHFSEFLLRMRQAPILIGEMKGNEYSDAFPNGPQAENETETEPDSEMESEPGSEAESIDEAESEPESETESGSEAESEPGSEAEPVSEAESEPESGSDAESEPGSETESETESKSEAESETESEMESKSEAESETESETEPASELHSEAEESSEAENETESETAVDPLAALNPELAEAFRMDLGGLVADEINSAPAAETESVTESETESVPEETAPAGETAGSDSKKSDSGSDSSDSGRPEETEPDLVSDMISASEPELSSEEESEIIFTPVEMGSGINTTTQLPEEAQAAAEAADQRSSDESSASPESSADGSQSAEAGTDSETAQDPGAENESAQAETADIRPRHAAIAVPQIRNMNSARVCLYDYRMLRSYPLAVLPKDMHILYDRIRETTASFDGTWSVYVGNLSTGQALVVGDRPMKSASVMKLFIMAAVYDRIDQGLLERTEETVSLLRSMITDSSNEAANRLLLKLGDGSYAEGVAVVNRFLQMHGYSSGTHEYNGFQDSSSFVDPSHFNQIMAKDIGLLLSRIYYREFISRSVCNEIESMMLDQKTRYKIPKGLPEGVQVGNKTGEMDSVQNDAAVIYGRNVDYVIIVLSMDVWDKDAACQNIQEISRLTYNFFED